MLTDLLKSHFLNLYHIALCDMQIEPVELEKLYSIGIEKGISTSEIDSIVLHPDKIKFHAPNTLDLKIELLYDMALIAWSDGVIDVNERNTMELFCKKFGFEEENITTIVDFVLDEGNKKTELVEVLKIVNQNL